MPECSDRFDAEVAVQLYSVGRHTSGTGLPENCSAPGERIENPPLFGVAQG